MTATYRLLPVIDLGANVFSTLIAISHSPESLNSARFIGLDANAGYFLPWNPARLSLKVGAGLYYWTMGVDKSDSGRSDFGLESAVGPYLLIRLGKNPIPGRSWWVQFKLANFASSIFDFSPGGNVEYAIGGGIDLFANQHKPWALTLDFSDTSLAAESNDARLFSGTLGVQKSL
jgi:hypothetical protein